MDTVKSCVWRTRALVAIASLPALVALSACGVVAAPCRVSSALIDMVPVVGHPLATPTDTCADVIDPKSTGEH